MRPENIEDIHELSPLQQGMLFHCLLAPQSHVYYAQQVYTLPGELNDRALERAWQRVVDRHSALRSSFQWEGLDKPVQVVHRQVDSRLERHDWREQSSDAQHEQLQMFLEKQRSASLALSAAPLLRVALMRTAANRHQLVVSYPHLLLDGWSLNLVLQEVCGFYNAYCQDRELALEASRPFGDYIGWLQAQDYSKAECFWRKELEGFTTPTAVTARRAVGRLSAQPGRYGSHSFRLSTATTSRLKGMCRRNGLTVATLLNGAWAVLLSRLTNEVEALFGVTVAGRPAELRGVESMIGPFINTQPFRVKVARGAKILTWLRELQARQVEMRQYEYSPLVQIHGWSEVPRSAPLFESVLAFEDYSIDVKTQADQRAVGLTIARGTGFGRISYPLAACMTDRGDVLVGTLDYSEDSFDAVTIARMAGHFQKLLEAIAAAPDAEVSSLSLLTDAESHQVSIEWNDTTTAFGRDLCIHQLFEAEVQRTPDANAVVCGEEHLTYDILNRSANRLAHYLLDLGVGPEVRVGICVQRTVQMVVGLLAILKAGGVYVPLDSSDSRERLTFMLEDASVSVLVTESQLRRQLPDLRIPTVCLDSDQPLFAGQRDVNPVTTASSGNLAYVIYTSGSTGRPKGVAIEHRSATTFLQWARDAFAPEDLAGVLASTSICFDCSIFELYAPLSWGGQVILAENDLHLPSLPSARAVTLLSMAPSTLSALLKVGGVPNSLRTVNLGGEASSQEFLRQLSEQDIITRVFHVYGPTEATTYSTYASIRPQAGGSFPIGRPIADTAVYILDRHGNLLPTGYPGELHIAGMGVARGYLNRADLTGGAFVPDPCSPDPGARRYRTGDMARYLNDGNIEFLGRRDHQVKIRGYRVELGELEAALRRHPAVQDAIVIVAEETPGDKHLVAYVASEPQQKASLGDLRAFVRDYLPEYMVPSWFIVLDDLPRTSHGKVNRRALPAPSRPGSASAAASASPRTALERVIASIWQDVLRIPAVGIHDNFFDLGGHSLSMLQVHGKLREALAMEISLVELFQHSTVGDLALHLSRERDAQTLSHPGSARGRTRHAAIERQHHLARKRQASRARKRAELG